MILCKNCQGEISVEESQQNNGCCIYCYDNIHSYSFTFFPKRFEHDCNSCFFLGNYMGVDLYFCNKGRITVIARHSSEAGDYTSGLIFADNNLFLKEAKLRAQIINLLKL